MHDDDAGGDNDDCGGGGGVAAAAVIVVKFDSICHAEGFGLSLPKGCDFIASLTLCIQHPLKPLAILQLRISLYGLKREVGVQLAQAGFRETITFRTS